MDYSETYIKFRDEYCPGLDIDDPRVFIRLEEEITRLKKKLGKE